MAMKTSTELRSAAALVGERTAIELIAKAGFDGWDFSLYEICKYSKKLGGVPESDHPLAGPDYLKFVRQLRRMVRITASSATSPMRRYPPMPPLSAAF